MENDFPTDSVNHREALITTLLKENTALSRIWVARLQEVLTLEAQVKELTERIKERDKELRLAWRRVTELEEKLGNE